MSKRERERKRRKLFRALKTSAVCLSALAVALLFLILPFRTMLPATRIAAREEGELRVHFLSVGQGDCTIVEFPDGEALVVDAGDGSFSANNAVVSYLNGLDVERLSLLITHADIDHYGGAREILRNFRIHTFYLPVIGSDSSDYAAMQRAVLRENCPIAKLTRYDTIVNSSGAYVVCVSPHAAGEDDVNDASTVLFVSYEGVNVLLTADISKTRERQLLRELELSESIFDSGDFRVRLDETDVLKVSHHGSADSSSTEWLTYLSAEAAIISCGAGNNYKHPAQETLNSLTSAGTHIYRTDELGHIILSVRDGRYEFTY